MFGNRSTCTSNSYTTKFVEVCSFKNFCKHISSSWEVTQTTALQIKLVTPSFLSQPASNAMTDVSFSNRDL